MLALLLSALALAAPPVSEEQTYERLFNEAPTAESVAAPAEPGASPNWTIPLGILLLGGGALLYKRLQTPRAVANQPALRVVQRQGIGDRNALVLVEVVEPGGDTRRLLIGTGAGAPALLADLGLSEEAPANTAMEAPKAEAKETKGETKGDDKKPRSAFAEEPEKKPRSAFSEEAEKKPRLSANNIADEILAERSPSTGRAREFSKILARIGEE